METRSGRRLSEELEFFGAINAKEEILKANILKTERLCFEKPVRQVTLDLTGLTDSADDSCSSISGDEMKGSHGGGGLFTKGKSKKRPASQADSGFAATSPSSSSSLDTNKGLPSDHKQKKKNSPPSNSLQKEAFLLGLGLITKKYLSDPAQNPVRKSKLVYLSFLLKQN